jgi:hypothetical protein
VNLPVTGIAIVMATIVVDNFGEVNDGVALVSDLDPDSQKIQVE